VRSPRRRPRDLRADRQTILGGLGLATAALVVLALLLALAWLQGTAREWPGIAWLALGALAAVLLSLEVLFVHDYARMRRVAAPSAAPSRAARGR
jgi:hypothetical protein